MHFLSVQQSNLAFQRYRFCEIQSQKRIVLHFFLRSGKSTTAIELLRTILIAIRGKRGNRLAHIAVCAPSNQAVDVLFMKNTGMVSPNAQRSFVPFCLRIGNEDNFSSTVRRIFHI